MKNAVKRPGRSGLRGLQKRRKLHEKNEEDRGSFLCILYGCHGIGRLRQKGNFTDSRNWKCSHDGEGGRVRFRRTHRTDYDGLYRPALGNPE